MDGNAPVHDRVNDLSRPFFSTLVAAGLGSMVLYLLLSLASALAGSVAAIILVPLVEPHEPLPHGMGWLASGGVGSQVTAFVAASTCFALARWWTARLGARLASRYGMQLRQRVHAQLIDAPLSSLSDATSAEIANALTYNVEIITQGFNALLQLLVAALTTLVSVAFALWLSPPLVLAVPVIVLFGLVASRISSREQASVSRQYVADMTQLFWLSEDFPRRWRHIRSFGREQAEKQHYAAMSARLGQGYRRQLELIASGRLVLELLAAAGIAGIFLLASHWHGVDQAALIAVCLLLGRLLPYLVSTRQGLQQLRSSVPAFALWHRYAAMDALPMPAMPSHAMAGVLHVQHLRLSSPVAIDVRDLWLVPGELTLVSGDSGMGKSSLADVLAGMVTPEIFHARLDGNALSSEAYRHWVQRGAYVSQSVRPWQRTVRECLRWAAPNATDAQMVQALADVGLDRRLGVTAQALDATLMGSTGRLSGGEIQRLLLAQVLLRQPTMALLDEATGALDAESELAVLATMKRRLTQTILLVISHRDGVGALADRHLCISGAALSVGSGYPPVSAPERSPAIAPGQ